MNDFIRAVSAACKGLCSRISKEIKDLDVLLSCRFRLFDELSAEIPVRCLLGEKSGVLESSRLDNECQRTTYGFVPDFLV